MLFVAICLACAIYARSIRGEFLFDDHAIKDMDFPRRSAILQGSIDFDDPGNRASPPVPVEELIRQTAEDSGPHADDGRVIWFPSALRSFCLEPRSLTHLGYLWTWKLCRFDPEGWHLVNLYLHCANIYLVYLFAKLFLPIEPAGIAALIFAVHPLQVAAVSYISGRAGLQSVFFSLASLLIVYQKPFHLWEFPVAVLSLVFAQRSKEDGFAWFCLFYLLSVVFSYFIGLI